MQVNLLFCWLEHTHALVQSNSWNLSKLELLYCPQKLSLDDSRISGGQSISERSLNTPASSQSPATYENTNIVIFEVSFLDLS